MTSVATPPTTAAIPRASYSTYTPGQRRLDLWDIQEIVGRGIPYHRVRYHYFGVPRPHDPSDDVEAEACAARGRAFVGDLIAKITSSLPPDDGGYRPSAISIAFTHRGLAALRLPWRTLDSFPLAYKQGMRARAPMLIDQGESAPDKWDEIWSDDRVHIWIAVQAFDAPNVDVLARESAWVIERAEAHGIPFVGSQDGGLLKPDGTYGAREHFGYVDGIGNPDVEGFPDPSPPGNGKPDGKGGWSPIAPGEFILGQTNEAGEVLVMPLPNLIGRNGTFMAFRKLHQKVGAFRAWLDAEGARYPGGKELLAAKVVGRWRDGTPLVKSPDKPMAGNISLPAGRMPTLAELSKLAEPLADFVYGDDPTGSRCPMGAHMRRMNPRDSLGFDGVLVNQRRILRRGAPYGEWADETTPADDTIERGVMFMSVNASIEEQFEFVQRDWMNYGNDFHQGNDPDPLLGNHDHHARMLIQGDAKAGTAPHICPKLPNFVVTRGGDYFFIPSLTALRVIASGNVETA